MKSSILQSSSVRTRAALRGLSTGLLLSAELVCFLAGLSACHSSQRPTTIALITPLTTSEVWKAMHAGVYRTTADAHLQRYWNGPTHEYDFDRQLELVEQQLHRGVSGIVLAPVHASALAPAVAQAAQAGVPIVVVANALATPGAPAVASVTSDDAAAGRMAADAIAERVGRQGTVAIVGLDPANSATLVRAEAFRARLLSNWPGLRVVLLSHVRERSPRLFNSGFDPAQYDRVSAIFALNTSSAHEVLTQRNAESGSFHTVIVACDQDQMLYDALRSRRLDVLIAENAYRMGLVASQEVVEALRTHHAPRSYILAPLLITPATIDSPDAQRFLKPYAGFDR